MDRVGALLTSIHSKFSPSDFNERPDMRFGVNYTPRVGWFHSWLDLDLRDTRRDFEQIAELGLDHVRVFPLWPLLQPCQ